MFWFIVYVQPLSRNYTSEFRQLFDQQWRGRSALDLFQFVALEQLCTWPNLVSHLAKHISRFLNWLSESYISIAVPPSPTTLLCPAPTKKFTSWSSFHDSEIKWNILSVVLTYSNLRAATDKNLTYKIYRLYGSPRVSFISPGGHASTSDVGMLGWGGASCVLKETPLSNGYFTY